MDYIIEFDYDADETDELTIRKGDIINNVRFHEDGWMIGILRGKEGVFPSNFGKQIKEDKRKSQEDLMTSTVEDNKPIANTEEMETAPESTTQKKVMGVGFGNIFSQGKITLRQTNNKDKSSKTVVEEVKLESSLEKVSQNKPKAPLEMVKVLHSYKAENPDELTLEEGEIITVLNKEDEDEGWWKGQKANGQIGVFPDNFVEIVKNPPEEPPKSRPNAGSLPKLTPPPVLAAKPKLAAPNKSTTTPARPPQISKTNPSMEKTGDNDGISFDTVVTHKPLVGPTADRAKRPKNKLPSSTNLLATSNSKPDEEKPAPKNNITRDSPTPDSQISEITVSKRKSMEISSKPTEKTTDNIPENSNSKVKDPVTSINKSSSVLVKENLKSTVEKIPDSPQVKSYQKSLTLPKDSSPDPHPSTSTTPESNSKSGLEALQNRISHLESENNDLKRELLELKKSSADQMNILQKKLNKFIAEFDEEKAKRVATEVSLTRLKDNVEDLETAMLSKHLK